jgi:hypothetical protein
LGAASCADAANSAHRELRLLPVVATAPLLPLNTVAVALRLPGGAVLEIADVTAVPPEWLGAVMSAAAGASR